MTPLAFRLSSVVLGAPDAAALALFYERLLDWRPVHVDVGWVKLTPPGGGTAISIQQEPGYVPPIWPSGPGDQQMQAHLDIGASDLPAAEALAASLGAVLADFQPQDDVRVYLDPAGHPFCLFESRPASGSGE
ncbi:MAG: VOC family protein [Actinomycetota bacterium]|nr:VOC family protein [Actinomycetota bacterium]